MSSKNKKNKLKSKLSDDSLGEIKSDKKINIKRYSDDSNDSGSDNDEHHHHKHKKHQVTRKRKRNHTKISHNSIKENKDNNNFISDDKNEKGKKVRFAKIDIIDVESWKKLNLKMTAEENLEELLKITEGKKDKDRVKNIGCCKII